MAKKGKKQRRRQSTQSARRVQNAQAARAAAAQAAPRRKAVYDQTQDTQFAPTQSYAAYASSVRADNGIEFPAQPQRTARQPRSGGSRPAQNTTPYPGSRRRTANGRLRPTQENLRSPARREKRKQHRMTRASVKRRRLMRRLTAFAMLLCVIAAGVYLTVTMLFKISSIRVQTPDGTVVEELGGYSSAQILDALNVHLEENIFSFDPSAKAETLERVFPLLENVAVVREYPGTVVVRAEAAQPAYALQTTDGWLTLSVGLKILSKDAAQPALPTLYGGEPVSQTPGEQLAFDTEEEAQSEVASSQAAESGSASASSEAAAPAADTRLDTLNRLLAALDSYGLRADVTRIEFADTEQMAFLYQDRISVELGTLNELDYKLKLAQYVLLNEDGKGCAATDTGVLDLSHLSASSTRKFRFAQGEPTMPSGYVVAKNTEEEPTS